ncbi:G-type lectin S-receptor-like serine threonine kinase At4g27290 isoform X1, putative [Babesia ovis]|uniref:G-type lectin S-receptor-like serine threonine kinase At4g27290 isoform X1, putative n=1 Tax=Babesia ovis TaxID=5869 RepID=A0A9W5TCW5_BABOV|nr:G-type lectin S-receptor-like serine threonine kinase At4g27290 isoform X1, putative [Babesia ovis]
MDVPPVVRVTLERVTPEGLGRFARVSRAASLKRCEGGLGMSPPPRINTAESRQHIRLEKLITLGVKDSVDLIQQLAQPTGTSCSKECLRSNLKTLSQWISTKPNPKWKPKDIRILKYRITSILDLLSLQDTAKVAAALAHIDTRLDPLYKPIVEHYCKHVLIQDAIMGNPEDMMVSTGIMMTSIEMFARIQSQKQTHDTLTKLPDSIKTTNTNTSLLGVGQLSPAVGETNRSEVDWCHYIKLLGNILKQSLTDLDTDILLLLADVMGNISVPLPGVCESVFMRVDLAKLDRTALSNFINVSALAMNIHKVDLNTILEECITHITSDLRCTNMKLDTSGQYDCKLNDSEHSDCKLDTSSVAKIFHALYLSGKLDNKLVEVLANHIVTTKAVFSNNADFYRTAIPLAITGQLGSQNICQWVLHYLASNADELSKDRSHFLFLLTTVANSVEITWKTREKLPLHAVALETDIYEKAEMFLRQQDGDKNYFPSTRAAVIYLIDRANSYIKSSAHDEFVQILLLNCVKKFKPDSRIKFELLNECKKRVNEISCGAIPQVLQTLFTLFSPNAPELIDVMVLYLERVLAELTIYNSDGTKQIEGTRLFTLTFMQDINLLGNMLAIFDRCNLNRGDLATQVVKMLERSNYRQIESADQQTLIDVLHYLAFSLDHHDAIDVIAIVILQKIKDGAEFSAGQLAAIAECFIAAPMALNPLKHPGLLKAIRERANDAKGEVKALKKILEKLNE